MKLSLQTPTKHREGKFVVKIPYNEKISKLGESKQLAIKRFHGPEWLNLNVLHWPIDNFQMNNELTIEKKTTVISNVVTEQVVRFDIFERFSNFKTLIAVFAYVLRFVKHIKSKNRIKGSITPAEKDEALSKLIVLIQNEYFCQYIKDLKRNGRVARRSPLLPLSPFLDENNLVRVGGRLSNSNYSFDKKIRILLPQHHVFTKLLLFDKHKDLLHCGAQTLLASIREQYWPIGGKTLTKRITRDCVKCFRVRPRAEKYQMGNLPATRITPSRPFSICGTDFAGPFLLKDRLTRGAKLVKSYVCIFICFSTKAVHLELVADLTTDSFIAALNRFVSRRGLCSNIYSDNGTNYVGANNELMRIYEMLGKNVAKINNDLQRQGITWHFTPARSPHFGGLWESTVKIFKAHLSKIIGVAHLAYDEFTTMLTRVEACLNSRPLSPLSEDPTDLNPLTPGHFLVGSPLLAVPERDLTDATLNTLSRWEKTQQMMQHFWRRWVREYISLLQTRTKWQAPTDNQIQVGDMVLVKQENTPPLQWPLGRIIEVFPGQDGITRVAAIKTSKGVIKRSTKRLCKLPLQSQC